MKLKMIFVHYLSIFTKSFFMIVCLHTLFKIPHALYWTVNCVMHANIIFPLWNAFASKKYSFAVKFYVCFLRWWNACTYLYLYLVEANIHSKSYKNYCLIWLLLEKRLETKINAYIFNARKWIHLTNKSVDFPRLKFIAFDYYRRWIV